LAIVGGFGIVYLMPVTCKLMGKYTMEDSVFIYAQVGLVIDTRESGDVNGVGPLL
jgi:hypothetical protein